MKGGGKKIRRRLEQDNDKHTGKGEGGKNLEGNTAKGTTHQLTWLSEAYLPLDLTNLATAALITQLEQIKLVTTWVWKKGML